MLASDSYLSHLVAATVQTATVQVVSPVSTDPNLNTVTAAALPSASVHLVLVTIAIVLLQTVLVHITLR